MATKKYCKRPECVEGNGTHLARDCWRSDRQREKNAGRRSTSAIKADSKRGIRASSTPSGHARCEACSGLAKMTAIGLERHKVPSSSIWCHGGTVPASRAKGKRDHRGKSVRAVGGGLPTLGK